MNFFIEYVAWQDNVMHKNGNSDLIATLTLGVGT